MSAAKKKKPKRKPRAKTYSEGQWRNEQELHRAELTRVHGYWQRAEKQAKHLSVLAWAGWTVSLGLGLVILLGLILSR